MYKGTRWEDIRKNQRLDYIIYQPTQDTFDSKGDHRQSLQDKIPGLSRENQDIWFRKNRKREREKECRESKVVNKTVAR